MAASGFYNHYDDPDEFWDEEPLEVAPSHRVGTPEVTPGAPDTWSPSTDRADSGREVSNPYQKSSLVDVELRYDRLPTAIRLSRTWKDAFDPTQYGRSIMDAYRYAVFETAARMAESGTIPPATLPTLRQATPLLLRTRTYDEFKELYDQLFLLRTYTVHGTGYNEYDEPGLVVTGTRSRLVSVAIDPGWAAATDAHYIAQDIVECCDILRAKKPEFVRDIYLDQESDRELAARLIRHENLLLGSAF